LWFADREDPRTQQAGRAASTCIVFFPMSISTSSSCAGGQVERGRAARVQCLRKGRYARGMKRYYLIYGVVAVLFWAGVLWYAAATSTHRKSHSGDASPALCDQPGPQNSRPC
jgi:hypothetical protein